MWKHCGILSGLLISTAALAEEMPREYRSARYLGMGDTGVSLAEGHDAIFYNPAGMADVKTLVNELILASPQVSVSANAQSLYRELKGNSEPLEMVKTIADKPEHVGVQNFTGAVFRRAALGVLQKADVNAFVGTDPLKGMLVADARAVARVGLYSAFGRAFLKDSLLLGAVVKFSHKGEAHVSVDALSAEEKFKNTSSSSLLKEYVRRGNAFGMDLGAIWKLDGEMNPRLGITVQNVGHTTYSWAVPGSGKKPLPDKQQVNLGFSVAPGTKRSHSVLAIDFHDALNVHGENVFKRIHMGGRISFENVFGVTAGLNQGYPTYGAFLDLKVVRVEGGMYSEELETFPGDRRGKRMYGRISMGWTR